MSDDDVDNVAHGHEVHQSENSFQPIDPQFSTQQLFQSFQTVPQFHSQTDPQFQTQFSNGNSFSGDIDQSQFEVLHNNLKLVSNQEEDFSLPVQSYIENTNPHVTSLQRFNQIVQANLENTNSQVNNDHKGMNVNNGPTNDFLLTKNPTETQVQENISPIVNEESGQEQSEATLNESDELHGYVIEMDDVTEMDDAIKEEEGQKTINQQNIEVEMSEETQPEMVDFISDESHNDDDPDVESEFQTQEMAEMKIPFEDKNYILLEDIQMSVEDKNDILLEDTKIPVEDKNDILLEDTQMPAGEMTKVFGPQFSDTEENKFDSSELMIDVNEVPTESIETETYLPALETLPENEIEIAAQDENKVGMENQEIEENKSDISVDQSKPKDNAMVVTSQKIETDKPEKETDEKESEMTIDDFKIPSEMIVKNEMEIPTKEIDETDVRQIGIVDSEVAEVQDDEFRSLIADLDNFINNMEETVEEEESRILEIK